MTEGTLHIKLQNSKKFQLWLEQTHRHTPQIVDSRAAYFAAKKNTSQIKQNWKKQTSLFIKSCKRLILNDVIRT